MSPRSLFALALACSVIGGCKFHPDIDWEGTFDFTYDFYDPTEYPESRMGDRNLNHSIPVGARLDVAMREHNTELDGGLIAHSGDTTIIVVEEEGDTIVGLRAVGEGEVTVRFDTESGGQAEERVLRVEPIDHGEVVGIQQGWLGTVGVIPDRVESAGLALRPGAIVTFGFAMFDDEDDEMSGYDFVEWSWDGALFTDEPAYDWVNSIELRASGTDALTTVETDHGAALELRTLDETTTPELRFYDANGSLMQIDEITGDASPGVYGLGHFDEDDRWVVPSADEQPTITVLEGPEDLILEWEYWPGDYGITMTTCPGEGVIEIAHVGTTIEVPVNLGHGPDTWSACD
jgi:hypothetical protein